MRATDSDVPQGERRGSQPDIFRFLDLYAPALLSAELRERACSTEGLFLSVVVRTQGTRSELLREALLCLAAQDCADFEVIVVSHDAAPDAVAQIQSDVGLVEAVLLGRVHVIHVSGGSRARPVVAGVGRAVGRYAVVLDDDDHVLANWVSTYRGLWVEAPGKVLRVGSAVRETSVLRERASGVRVAVSSAHPKYCDPWVFDDHLVENRTPFHAFAFPVYAVRELGISFDESLDVVEDWDFLLRVASALGVHETQRVTAIYNHGAPDASKHVVEEVKWRAVEEQIRERHRQSFRLTSSESLPSHRRRLPRLKREDMQAFGRSVSYVYSTEGTWGVLRRVKERFPNTQA